MKEFQLFNGDCLELLKNIQDKSIDMILCDLPYGKTACEWDSVISFEKLWEQYNRIAKDNAAIVLFACAPFGSALRMSNIKNYKYDWIWDKKKGTGFLNAKKQPMRNHELICVFYKKQCIYNPQKTTGHKLKKSFKPKTVQTDVYGEMKSDCIYESSERYPRSILVFSTDTQKCALHPTQKPVALLEYLIKTYTNKGDVVLDNCMGSGSTGVACVNTHRRFVGMELNETYFNIAKERIEHAKVQLERNEEKDEE